MGQFASHTDEALLQAAIGGQQRAWVELVDRYHSRALRRIRRQIDDPFLAQDILQNTWTSLVQAVRKDIPVNFAGFFWTLLNRRVTDAIRKRGRTKEIPILESPAPGDPDGSPMLERQESSEPDPQTETVRLEAQELLHRALKQLPDHYRLVIQARQLEGRSNKETARLLVRKGIVTEAGNVEKRVENYYYRGLKELKRQLEALGYTEGESAT